MHLLAATYPRHILHAEADIVAPGTAVHAGTFNAAGVLRAVGLALGLCRCGAGGAGACGDRLVGGQF